MPALLLLDLDDTILRFSAGQPNFWRRALERRAPQLVEQHARLEQRIAAVNHEYWSDDARAFWGRQNMHQARRIVARTALATEGLGSELCDLIADDMTEEKEAHVRPFDGALDALHQLRQRGQRMGLLTNGCSAFQRRKLRRYELEPLFELILIEGELGYGKPDERVFRGALQHFGVPPEETWMVGDNLSADIAGAQRVGITGIWHDVAGKGLPAALFMASVSGLFKVLGSAGQLPDRLLAGVNERLAESNDACMFVTMGCGFLDVRTGLLRYASAGHDPPLLVEVGGNVESLAAETGPALGVEAVAAYPLVERYVAPGDTLVLYTDGVTEASTADGALFGLDRLSALLRDRSGEERAAQS